MPSRRPFALVAAVLLLCVPVLSSCGFNKATSRPYTQADGVNYKVGSFWVLNAVIAAAQSNSGTLIASLSNQSDTSSRTLDLVAGASGNTVTVNDFTPVRIRAMGFVNLADDPTPITVSGDFDAGDIIPLSLNLTDGSTITMNVPVVYACQKYAGLDVSQSAGSAGSSDTATPLASPLTSSSAAVPTDGGTRVAPTATTGATTAAPATGSASPSTATTATPSITTEPTATGSPSAYTCGISGGTGGRN